MEIDDHRIDKDDLENIEIAVDSTRVSIYNNNSGRSKLNIRERKYNGYDQVRKLHIVLNVNDKKAINMKYTHGVAADYLSACRGNKYKVRSVRADAAYDIRRVYKECEKYNLLFGLAKICLADYLSERNKYISKIRSYENYEDGINEWKKKVKYGVRSYIEVFFHRLIWV